MERIHLSYRGIDDMRWDLEGRVEQIAGAVLGSLSGMVAEIDLTTRGRATGIGVDVVGRDYPAMTGTLSLGIRPWDGRKIGHIYSMFTRSWSTEEDGRLSMKDGRSRWWHTSARLASEIAPPNPSPWTPGLPVLEMDLPILATDGAWIGETTKYRPGADGRIKIHNPGTVDVHPLVAWSGAGQWIITPDGIRVDLPTVAGTRYLSTNSMTGFVVTDADGQQDKQAWRSFRGLPVYGTIRPNTYRDWQVSEGVHLELTPLSGNPWR